MSVAHALSLLAEGGNYSLQGDPLLCLVKLVKLYNGFKTGDQESLYCELIPLKPLTNLIFFMMLLFTLNYLLFNLFFQVLEDSLTYLRHALHN